MLRSVLLPCLFLPCMLCLASLPASADKSLRLAFQSPLDIRPLRKALTPYMNREAIQTHTVLHFTDTEDLLSAVLLSPGIREDIQATALSTGQFRAVIVRDGAHRVPQKRLTIVSNGKTVWTYNPGLNRYSVSSFTAFREEDDKENILGLILGNFAPGLGYRILERQRQINPGTKTKVLMWLAGRHVTLSEHTELVGKQKDYVYDVMTTEGDALCRFYVNSVSDRLERLDAVNNVSDTQITVREDILQAAQVPMPSKSTFSFVPPPGAAKSAAVSRNPLSL